MGMPRTRTLALLILLDFRSTQVRAQECLHASIDSPAAETTWAYALGDANGDGHLDLLGGTTHPGRPPVTLVTVALGDGHGRFGTASQAPVGRRSSSATFADLDGDGKDEIVAAAYTERRLEVFGLGPAGRLRRRERIRLGVRPYAVAAHDLNGDERPDLVVTSRDGLRVLLQTHRGRYRLRQTLRLGHDPELPAVRDFDGDGHPDLVLLHNESGSAVYLRARGDGTFAPASSTAALCDGPFAATPGDFDSDGAPDVAYACARGRGIRFLAVTRESLRDGGQLVATDRGTWFTAGDVSGDGDAELVAAPNAGRDLAIFSHDGQRGWITRARVSLGAQHLLRPLLGDVDEDGRRDIVVLLGRNPRIVRVYIGAACDGPTAPVPSPAHAPALAPHSLGAPRPR